LNEAITNSLRILSISLPTVIQSFNASGSQTFSVHGALSVSGFFHGTQSQNTGIPNSCSVRLGWLS
jgi:hypothetical protein